MNYPYTIKLAGSDLAFDTALKTTVTPAKYTEFTKFGGEVTLAQAAETKAKTALGAVVITKFMVPVVGSTAQYQMTRVVTVQEATDAAKAAPTDKVLA